MVKSYLSLPKRKITSVSLLFTCAHTLMRTETRLSSVCLRRDPLYTSFHFLVLQYLILITDIIIVIKPNPAVGCNHSENPFCFFSVVKLKFRAYQYYSAYIIFSAFTLHVPLCSFLCCASWLQLQQQKVYRTITTKASMATTPR